MDKRQSEALSFLITVGVQALLISEQKVQDPSHARCDVVDSAFHFASFPRDKELNTLEVTKRGRNGSLRRIIIVKKINADGSVVSLTWKSKWRWEKKFELNGRIVVSMSESGMESSTIDYNLRLTNSRRAVEFVFASKDEYCACRDLVEGELMFVRPI